MTIIRKLDEFQKQVYKYSTGVDQLWYLLVFGVRAMVVSSLGGSVYKDEHSEFKCSTKEAGCEQMCRDQFTRINHIRFWMFQIVAVATPTALFHLYASGVESQINKIEEAEKEKKEKGDAISSETNFSQLKKWNQLDKRKKTIGQYKMKSVIRGKVKSKIPQTKKIQIANVINLASRLIIEIVFILYGLYLYNFEDGVRTNTIDITKIFSIEVPGTVSCQENVDLHTDLACTSHFSNNNGGVPCYVSRPYEKTFFIRYMNVFATICVVLTVLEIFLVVWRMRSHYKRKEKASSSLTEFNRGSNALFLPKHPGKSTGTMGSKADPVFGMRPGTKPPVYDAVANHLARANQKDLYSDDISDKAARLLLPPPPPNVHRAAPLIELVSMSDSNLQRNRNMRRHRSSSSSRSSDSFGSRH